MGWVVEQNTGIGPTNEVIKCLWYKGYIYAGTRNVGVWRRDGIGPWVQVFVQHGKLWHWEDDDALYCGNHGQISRSVDGVAWALDVDLNVAFGLQGNYNSTSEIGGYGNYLYVANYDLTVPCTWFYRRDLAGNWAVFGAAHAGGEGGTGRGIIGFGGEVYWTNGTHVRYWDGAAWAVEVPLDGNCGTTSYMSVINNRLYIGAPVSALHPHGGYYWKTSSVTNWSFLTHELPDNTWSVFTLNEGADGETYTWATPDGTDIRVYRRVGNQLSLIMQDTAGLIAIHGLYGGVGVDAAGDMYLGGRSAATVRFFAFVPTYNLTATGGGLYPQAMDCDADGDMLYIGLYDTATAQPILVSVALPLDGAASMGSNVFSPGAGDAINVKCNSVSDNLVVSGNFGVNEQVETSDDGATTWTDIDRDAWGAETAQPSVVDPLTVAEVMVALATAQDITETDDAGATAWVVNNAAVGYSPGAMALLPNGDEMIIGDDAANRIDYSPNRGVTLTNITGAFAGGGNVAALEIT